LADKKVSVNVISVPCIEMFDASKLDKRVPVIAVELGSSMPWWALFGRNGLHGDVIGFDTFGYSGKEPDVLKALGFTPEQIAERLLNLLK